MTSIKHATLVKEATNLIATQDKLSDEALAHAIFSPTAARLSDVTPEMVEAVAKALHDEVPAESQWHDPDVRETYLDRAKVAIAAYLAASPLTPPKLLDPLNRDQAYEDKLTDNFREWP